ncbi:Flagellar motor rotation protein MotA [hydrothermal vent metagenome]|uniref:Flagellar motor rotation protein MotA n=1 Tax=hydrothermal vent metagenome TaxID=652676 RepID=A0A3B0XSC0_9ZZZZ
MLLIRSMDILSIIGIVIAFVAILSGSVMEGGHLGQLFQLTAFIIVVGGTVGAALLQTTLPVFWRAMSIVRWVFVAPKVDLLATIDKIINWSQLSRREGLLALENASEDEQDLFSRKGLQMLVDGNEPESIRNVMETEIGMIEQHDLQAAKVFESMGGYSPTIGILGAVLGLIHVMNNLSDPEKLGSGIATAFVATIYGVGLANLLLLPVAGKLKAQIKQQSIQYEMTLEGVVSIAEGENPRSLQAKLQSYLGRA